MATFYGSTNSIEWGLRIDVYEISTNIVNNTSVVRVDLYLGRTRSNSYCGGSFSGSISVGGQVQNYSGTIAYPTNVAAGQYIYVGVTKDFTIAHNDDGKMTVGAGANWVANFSPQSGNVSGTLELSTIPRASGIACSSPNIGDTAIITIDRKSTSFTNTVTYQIGTISGTIATRTTNTVLSLDTSSIEDNIYALIPNSREAQGTVYCETFNGNTKIGNTTSAIFHLYSKENVCKPNVSAGIVDTNDDTIAITGDSTKLIKYVSKPKVTITASPNKSATIKSYLINLNDGQISSLSEEIFSTISSNNILVNAADSRGYDNPQSIDLNDRMIDYIKLHIDSINLYRPEGTSNEVILNLNGVWFNGEFNEDNTNSLNVKYQYKKNDEINWSELIEITPTIDNNTFKFDEVSLGNIYDYDTEYQFKVIVNDLILTVGSLDADIIVVPKGQEVMAIGEDEGWLYGDWYLNDKLIELFDVYSEKERIVGSYFDKTLYQKTFELGILENMEHIGNSGELSKTFLGNYDKAINCEMVIVSPDDNSRAITERVDFDGPAFTSWAETEEGNLIVYVYRVNNVHYSQWIGYATVRYTKIEENTTSEEEENV